MKNTLFTLLLTLICATSFAQTQQGIVKTRGRMVNGQLVAGTKLSGATITLNFGNPLVSGNQGGFSFNVPAGKTYSLVMAKKQGYTLADPEYTRRSFKYSASNPFYVVLEDENQRQADINEATRKVRRTLTAQLQKREEEIESLKAKNKLTEKEYQERLKQLYDNQSKSELLVKEMAERYASTDYDQRDDFNQKVQMYIEEGELQKADSMIRSKGDMEKRVAEYHNIVEANKKERENLKQRQLNLEKSEYGEKKAYEDIANDLYGMYAIALQQYEWDEATCHLKMLADIDTTKIDAVWRYAQFALVQQEHNESLKYYQICERYFWEKQDTIHWTAILANIASIYYDKRDFAKAEFYCQQSLNNCYSFQETNPVAFSNHVTILYNNMGLMYLETKDFLKAEIYLVNTMELRKKMYQSFPDNYLNDYIVSLSNLSKLYFDSGNFYMAELYIREALDILQPVCEQDIYNYTYSTRKNKLGLVLLYQEKISEAEQHLQDAARGLETLIAKNKSAFKRDYAKALHDLGLCYSKKQDLKQSEFYMQKALELRKELYETDNDVYRMDLYQTQFLLGTIYDNDSEFQKAEPLLFEAKEHMEYLKEKTPYLYEITLAEVYSYICRHYCMLKDFEKADEFHFKANQIYELFLNKIDITEQEKGWCKKSQIALKSLRASMLMEMNSVEEALSLAEECYTYDSQNQFYKSIYAQCLNNYACIIATNKNFDEALLMITKAIALLPNEANIYDTKGEILLMQGKNVEALEMWKKVLELNPHFLDNYPDGTNLSNGLKKLGLIE